MINKSDIALAISTATSHQRYDVALDMLRRLNKGEALEGTVALPEHVTVEPSGTTAGSYSVNPADGHVTFRYPAERGRRKDEPVTLNVNSALAGFGPVAGSVAEAMQRRNRAFFNPIKVELVLTKEMQLQELLDSANCALRLFEEAEPLKQEEIANLKLMRDGYKARVGEMETELAEKVRKNGEWERAANRDRVTIGELHDEIAVLNSKLADTEKYGVEWHDIADQRADAIDTHLARIKELEAQLAEEKLKVNRLSCQVGTYQVKEEPMLAKIDEQAMFIRKLETQLAAKPKVELTVTGAGEVRINGTSMQPVEKATTITEYMEAGEFVATEHTDVFLNGDWRQVIHSERDPMHGIIRFYGARGHYQGQRKEDVQIRVRYNDGKPTHNEITIKAGNYCAQKYSHVKFRQHQNRTKDHWEQINATSFDGTNICFLGAENRLMMSRRPDELIEVRIRG